MESYLFIVNISIPHRICFIFVAQPNNFFGRWLSKQIFAIVIDNWSVINSIFSYNRIEGERGKRAASSETSTSVHQKTMKKDEEVGKRARA